MDVHLVTTKKVAPMMTTVHISFPEMPLAVAHQMPDKRMFRCRKGKTNQVSGETQGLLRNTILAYLARPRHVQREASRPLE